MPALSRRLAFALLPAILAGCAAAPPDPALEELLASCSVEITALVDAELAWAGALLEPHLLHEARVPLDLVVAGRPLRARAILLPVPRTEWPAHLLVREEDGIAVFTKYAPERLAAVLLDPAYSLGDSFAVAELRRLGFAAP